MAKYPEPIPLSEQKEKLLDQIKTSEANAIKLAEEIGKGQYPKHSIGYVASLIDAEVSSMKRNTDTFLKL